MGMVVRTSDDNSRPAHSWWSRHRAKEVTAMIHVHPTGKSAEFLLNHVFAALGGSMVSVFAASQTVSVWGAAIAGSAFMAVVGMLMAEVSPTFKVGGLTGIKRLIANWACGMSAGFIGPFMQRRYFPEDDVVGITGMTACVLALLGVVAFFVVLPKLLTIWSQRVNAKDSSSVQEK